MKYEDAYLDDVKDKGGKDSGSYAGYDSYETDDGLDFLKEYENISAYECAQKRPLTAEEIIEAVTSLYLDALEEMKESEARGEKLSDYAKGVKSAYVQTLQMFQLWEKQEEYGLNFDLEKIFRVE